RYLGNHLLQPHNLAVGTILFCPFRAKTIDWDLKSSLNVTLLWCKSLIQFTTLKSHITRMSVIPSWQGQVALGYLKYTLLDPSYFVNLKIFRCIHITFQAGFVQPLICAT
ncbi:hypothetical protein L195_g017427, partial [Trifolium pratense]